VIQNLLRNIPIVTKNLLIINLLVFFAQIIFDSSGNAITGMLAMYYPGSQAFQPYQIITSMFTHFSISHIFFNMFALIVFGGEVERILGAKRYLIFYFACGLGAVALSTLVHGFQLYSALGKWTVTDMEMNLQVAWDAVGYAEAGASGAIFGLLLGFAMYFPNKELMLIFLPIPIKAKFFIPALMLIELFMGTAQFEFDNMAHFAHLGGALIGFILIKIWQRNR
jgi:membrane associated rhomboid family serine protease